MNKKTEKQIVLNAISEITGMEITFKLEEAVASGLREIRMKKYEERQAAKQKWKERKPNEPKINSNPTNANV